MISLFIVVPTTQEQLRDSRRELSEMRERLKADLLKKTDQFRELREKLRGTSSTELDSIGREIVLLKAEVEACEDSIATIDSVRIRLEFEELLESQPLGAS